VGPEELAALADLPRRSSRLVVVNPASGPGTSRSAAYAEAVRRAQEAGMRVLGYVATGYGARGVAEVGANVDRYAAWYGVDGILLDEAAGSAELLAHYRALASRARGDGRLVVLNPGVVPTREYFDLADVVVTFEGPASSYGSALARMPVWLQTLPAGRIAHLVYGAAWSEARGVALAGAHAGYVYVNSGALPNPWRTLPSYLEGEERLLEGCEGPGRRRVTMT
jgi:hypothetical protein